MNQTIKNNIQNSFHIWRAELSHIFKDVGVILFFFVVPLTYPILYGIIYNTETVRDVPLVIVDQSKTSASREFARKIDASPDVMIVAYAVNMDEAIHMVNKKKAYGILVIPYEFSKNIHIGKRTSTTLYCDMSSLLHYKAFLLAATEASFEIGKEIQMRGMPSISQKIDKITSNPVLYESVALYNPQNGFASFLLPAILILVIQQTLLLGISMLAGTSRERNNLGFLIPSNEKYHGTFRIIFGKSLAYLTIYMLVGFWALKIVPHIFNLPQIAPFATILLFFLPFTLACIFFSMTISCFMKSREIPMMVIVFTSVPLLFISGISWPGIAIPDFWKWISHLFPSTFGIQGFIKLNSMGTELSMASLEYKILWIQTGFYFFTTFFLYRHQVAKRSQRQLQE